MSCHINQSLEEELRQERLREIQASRLDLRIQLLQELSVLEGKMSVSTKVDQGHIYDLLCIVRELVNRR